MVDGKAWKLFLVVCVLLAPATATAAAPRAGFQAPYGLDGQDISSFAADAATGAYAIAVPTFTTPKLPLLGQQTPRDVYLCDLEGAGCHAYRHDTATGANGDKQYADATSFNLPTGITARYAVGGPGKYVSAWSNLQARPLWTKQVLEGNVVGVAIEPTQASYVVAISSSTLGNGNRVTVFEGDTGRFLWDYNVTDLDGSTSDVRPTSVEFARVGGGLVVGTTKGVLYFPSVASKPTTAAQTNPVNIPGGVSEVLVSRAGGAILARTSAGIDYIPLVGGKPVQPHWSRPLPSTPSAIALSGDGERFAAATGSKVFFYAHRADSLIAQDLGLSYDANATITSLAYDSTGGILVATAGNNVLAFAPGRAQPVWNFAATQSVNGGLDGPLRGVAISDDARRVLVAGKTKIMPYETNALAEVVPASAATTTIQPGETQTVSFNVANIGSLPDNYTFVVTRPVGWAGSNPEALGLLPDQTQTVNLTVQAPPGVAPGPQAIKVELRSRVCQERPQACDARVQNAIVATGAINLTVPRAVSLAVELQDERVEMSAGDERSFPLLVRNLGNAEGIVNLSATQSVTAGPSWSIRFDPAQVRIGANGVAETSMVVTAPADAASGARNFVTVTAKDGTVEGFDNVSIFIDPEFQVDVATGATRIEVPAGESRTFTFNVTNRGNTDDRFNLTANVTPLTQANDWNVRLSEDQISIQKGRTSVITVTVRTAVAEPREDAVLVLRAVSIGSGDVVQDTANVPLVAKGREEEKSSFLPAPSVPLALAAVALVALARRLRGPGGA
jgi:hypothetical protein